MKLSLTLLISCLVLFSFTGEKLTCTAMQPDTAVTGDSVYICYSSTSYAYHSSPNCRGLNRCTHPLIKVSLEDAKNKYHHRACTLCE